MMKQITVLPIVLIIHIIVLTTCHLPLRVDANAYDYDYQTNQLNIETRNKEGGGTNENVDVVVIDEEGTDDAKREEEKKQESPFLDNIPISTDINAIIPIDNGNSNINNDKKDDQFISWQWPFPIPSIPSHDNNNNNNSTDFKVPDINTPCAAQTNCTSCIELSSFCHWCDSDSECHAIGSLHGCIFGSTCSKDGSSGGGNNNNGGGKDHSKDKCNTHTECAECALSSSLCHWCAKDDKCHAVGSWYGCAHGVDCFNNDRCMRKEPEKIDYSTHNDNTSDDNGDGSGDGSGGGIRSDWPIIVICIIGLVIFGCSTCCFVGVSAVKGTYDDWALVNVSSFTDDDAGADDNANANGTDNDTDNSASVTSRKSFKSRMRTKFGGRRLTEIDERDEEDIDDVEEEQQQAEEHHKDETKNISSISTAPTDTDTHTNDIETNNSTTSNQPTVEDKTAIYLEDDILNDTKTLSHPLLPSNTNNTNEKTEEIEPKAQEEICATTPLLATDTDHHHPSIHQIPRSNSARSSGGTTTTTTTTPKPKSSKLINCFYNTCLVWYILTISFAILFTFGSIYYYPKVPQFNVCSDQFAWNSIIKSLTSLKVEASFDILASVKNENHIGIVLDGIGGSFRHNNEEVGFFSMKTTTIEADSITDLLVTCTVKPDKWDILGLVADYYRGKLELLVDLHGSAKVKQIGFTIPISVKDFLVPVNEPDEDDRHLCHCPEWKDLTPTASPKLSFEEAMMDIDTTVFTDRMNSVDE